MKVIRSINYLLIAFLCTHLLMFSACGGDGMDDPGPTQDDPQTLALQKLTSSTWSLTSVTRNGLDVSNDFSGFSVTFTSTGFTTTNGTGAWEASGTWSWADDEGTSFTLDNGVLVKMAFSNNDTLLTLTFTLSQTTFVIGRTRSIAGTYTFVLSK